MDVWSYISTDIWRLCLENNVLFNIPYFLAGSDTKSSRVMPRHRRDKKLTALPAFLEGTNILCERCPENSFLGWHSLLFHEKPHNADFSVKACQLLVASPREEWALLWSSALPASASQDPPTPQLLLPGKIGESDMRARLVAEEAANGGSWKRLPVWITLKGRFILFFALKDMSPFCLSLP